MYVESFTNEGDLVVDPFNGSGSSMVACLVSNRNYCGMELEPRYVDLTLYRIQQFCGENEINIVIKKNGEKFDLPEMENE